MLYLRALCLTAAILVSGCSMSGLKFAELQGATPAAEKGSGASGMANAGDGNPVVQTVEFRPGISSATVERLAQRSGCVGPKGAGLITEKGPVEVYRMRCDNGSTFMARCDLRQCRPMR